jgi:predicted permease
MLKNYLTIAFRNLQRNKLYAALNVSGLAIGISACLVIYLIVSFELSFDTTIPERERIYRIYSQFSGTYESTNPGVTSAFYSHVQDQYSGIEASAAFHTFYAQVSLPENGKKFKALTGDIIVTQPDYFAVFSSYTWLAGSPQTSLTAPFQVVLTESKARTYFGELSSQQIVGQVIEYDDSLRVTVSGIVKDLPKPTDLIFNDFISFSTINQSWLKKRIDLNNWESTYSASQFFVKLAEDTKPHKIKSQLHRAEKIYAENHKDEAYRVAYHLQPLSDFHFNSKLGIYDRSRTAAHLPTLQALIGVALLLLLIAAINFINLITAQAVKRAKEVGVRKVLGGTRMELIKQFLSETMLITTLAVVVSLFLASLALSAFEEFIPKGVALHLSDPFTLAFMLITIAVVSVLSGLYPAFVLSSFAPALALKNQAFISSGKTRSAYLRKALIVFQFSFAQILIVGTLIMGGQIDFMLNKDMGFNQDAVINFSVPWNFWNNQHAEKRFVLKQELGKIPQINALSMHNQPPAYDGYSTNILEFDNGKEILKHNVYRKDGDTTYIHLYNIALVAGRNLQPSDTIREFLINETYARQLGFAQPAEAVGKILNYEGRYLPIVGVVKDFHIQSLHKAIEPVAIATNTDNFYDFSLKLSTKGKQVGDFKAVVSQIEGIWKELYPEEEFKYTFLDESIASFYEAEQRSAKLVSTATGIAILISCLGLFGLAAYTAQTRTKEIGIRKVLGASLSGIVALLSKDFLWLVLIANVIAWPLAWWGANRWLEGFAYQVDVSPWIFVGSGTLALIIALLTVSYQSIKAALANPVKSLRSE